MKRKIEVKTKPKVKLTRTLRVADCQRFLVVADLINLLRSDKRFDNCLVNGPLKLPSKREKAPCFLAGCNYYIES